MEKKKDRSNQFFNRSASKSIRPLRKGGGVIDMPGDPIEIGRSLAQQYAFHKQEIKRLDSEIRAIDAKINGGTAESILSLREKRSRLLSLRANNIRQRGNLGKVLREAGQLAFEKLFVEVAYSRLPSDHFTLIAQEARDLWRSDGWHGLIPEPTREKRRKQRRKLAKAA